MSFDRVRAITIKGQAQKRPKYFCVHEEHKRGPHKLFNSSEILLLSLLPFIHIFGLCVSSSPQRIRPLLSLTFYDCVFQKTQQEGLLLSL